MSTLAYNTTAYNLAGLNVGPFSTEAVPTSLLTFDGYNCDDGSSMVIEDMDFSSGPDMEIDQFNIPRARGIRIANAYVRSKIITATGHAHAASESAMESLIDDIKKNLRGANRELVTVWGGLTRLYTGTLQNMGSLFSNRKKYNIDWVPFTLQFLCIGPATDWDYTQWTGEITAANDTVSATGNGTIEGKPVVVIVFSASTGVTSMTVSIDENDNTISYSGALAAGDVLIFDSELETVTLNGTEVDFGGYFPLMALDDNTFRFVTNGSARTFRATILSKHSYL
jgi:phage-related protein